MALKRKIAIFGATSSAMRRILGTATTAALLVSTIVLSPVAAATAVGLGTAGQFAVLAGSTVTNTGPSVITGDVGVSPGTAVTGFPPGIVSGTIHAADAVALQAKSDLTIAYNNLAGQPCDVTLTDQDLGGLTLTAGVYCFSTSAQLTGTLTLDAEGDPNAVFIFQVGSTLTTASGSSVALINGAQACNVFFQIGSSATLGTATEFVGNILARTSITLNTGATLQGRALARSGAVTLDSNVITRATCGDAGEAIDTTQCTGTLTGGTFTGIHVPDGATCSLVGVAVAGDVTVGKDSRLATSSQTKIGGDVIAVGARSVRLINTDIAGDVDLRNTKGQIVIGSEFCSIDPIVGGGIRIADSWGTVAVCLMTVGRSVVIERSHAAVSVRDNIIADNLIVRGTRGYGLWIGRNTVTGYVLDRDNQLTSYRHFVRDNTIAGELRCFVNAPDPIQSGNAVGGASLGECAP